MNFVIYHVSNTGRETADNLEHDQHHYSFQNEHTQSIDVTGRIKNQIVIIKMAESFLVSESLVCNV